MTATIGLHVIAGYLGSGKTTFINAMLEAATEPFAVIVNDFGSVNVDAALISQSHDDVIELTNGCICCTVGDSLADTLYAILDRPRLPASILIEASGVADPVTIARYGHLGGLHPAGTLVLVDATQAMATHSDPLLARTFERQILGADMIAVTKTDMADETDAALVRELLARLAPDTPVVPAVPGVLASIMVAEKSLDTYEHPLHADHASILWPADMFATEEQWLDHLSMQPSGCVRTKGIVELSDGSRRLVQGVGRHLSISKTDAHPTGVVAILVSPPSSSETAPT